MKKGENVNEENVAIILVFLVLSGCEKNESQNDLIINNTEEENAMDENDDYELKNIEMERKEEKDISTEARKWLENAKGYTVRQIKVIRQILFLKKRQFIQ